MVASRFVFSRKSVALQLRTFATKSALFGSSGMSAIWSLLGGGLKRSTQHFISDPRDGVDGDGAEICSRFQCGGERGVVGALAASGVGHSGHSADKAEGPRSAQRGPSAEIVVICKVTWTRTPGFKIPPWMAR